MTKNEVIDLVDEEAILYDGFDSAIIGIAERCGMPTVVCYDKDKVLNLLKKSFKITKKDLDANEIADGVTLDQKKEEMAQEWFSYNTLGSWVGEYTPVFITLNTN